MNFQHRDNHLSPDHILARHEDPYYRVPYYPYDWDEIRWIQERFKTIAAEKQRKENDRIRTEIITRITYVLALTVPVIQKKEEDEKERQLAEVEKHRLAQKSREHMNAQAALKNSNGGPKGIIKKNLKPGLFNEEEDGFLIYSLLAYIYPEKEMSKGIKRTVQPFTDMLLKVLISRGIPTDTPSLINACLHIDGAKREEYRKRLKIK